MDRRGELLYLSPAEQAVSALPSPLPVDAAKDHADLVAQIIESRRRMIDNAARLEMDERQIAATEEEIGALRELAASLLAEVLGNEFEQFLDGDSSV